MPEIVNFIKRHATWFLIGLISCLGFLFIPEIPNFVQVIILSIVISSLAIFIAGFAVYTYTPIKFTDVDIKPDIPEILQACSILGKYFVLGSIFIGICLLILGVVVGTYFVMFAS